MSKQQPAAERAAQQVMGYFADRISAHDRQRFQPFVARMIQAAIDEATAAQQQRIEALVEALCFYQRLTYWMPTERGEDGGPLSCINLDRGKRARAALAQAEQEGDVNA